MEQFIVIAKPVAGTTDKFEEYQTLKFDTNNPANTPIPDGFVKLSDPASLDDCKAFIAEKSKNDINKPPAENEAKAGNETNENSENTGVDTPNKDSGGNEPTEPTETEQPPPPETKDKNAPSDSGNTTETEKIETPKDTSPKDDNKDTTNGTPEKPAEPEKKPPDTTGEQFVVVALATSPQGNPKSCRIVKYGDLIPATQKIVFGPNTKEEGEKFIDKNCEHSADKDPRFIWLTFTQYMVIFVVTVSFVALVYFGVKDNKVKDDQSARALITYLVAVSTVGIATLAILTAMLLRDFKERFDSAKEVLTVLVGILGTIVGFYYGQATNSNQSEISLKATVPKTVARNQENEINIKLINGKTPYHYTINFEPPTVPLIKGDSDDGEVKANVDLSKIPAETTEIKYSIDVTDANGKHLEEKDKKIPVSP